MRLATVQVSRVFTTGISRNKEIHLKVLIEDDSKIFGSSSIGFRPTDSSATHIKGQWENLVCRIHAGSGKVLVTMNHAGSDSYRGGGLHRQKSRRQQQKPALLRVLRNSPRAMPLTGYELVRQELTCNESALLCFL